MKKYWTGIIFLLLSYVSHAQQPKLGYEDIYGSYEIDMLNGGVRLDLKEDKTFIQEWRESGCLGGHSKSVFAGTYHLQGNAIIFKPAYQYKENSFGQERETVVELVEDEANDTTYTWTYETYKVEKDTLDYTKPEDFVFNDTLYVVPFDGQLYLLGAEKVSAFGYELKTTEIQQFINTYNAGTLEWGGNDFWHKDFDASASRIKFMRALPDPWDEYVLKKPVEAVVQKIEWGKDEEGERVAMITINRGSRDGVKKSMRFYATAENRSCTDLRIVEVNKSSSVGYASLCALNKTKGKFRFMHTVLSTADYPMLRMMEKSRRKE